MAQPQQYRRLSKFELHELIGEGAMGVVWKAYDSVLRRYVALKLLSTQFAKTHDMRERFLREARAAGALQHPNIVTVYDLGEAEGQLFIAMELVEGRDLSELIASREPLALERKLDIVLEVLQGLHYAHERGVVHRDVKPSNVRIATDGRVKIMDFGIARLQSADTTGSGAIVGTPTYMAPEQITNGAISAATDVFGVGCLLYELLTYQKPFEGESLHGVLYQVLTTDPKPLRTMAPSIPASLERVVAKAMNKVPQDRYETARQMHQMLLGIRAALSGATDSTTQRLGLRWTPIPAPVLKLVAHTPLKWRATVLAALVLVVGALVFLPGPPPAPIAASAAGGGALEGGGDAAASRAVPDGLNPALAALRDSAFAARDRAQLAGAMKNDVPALLLAETILRTSEQAVSAGDVARASNGWREAVLQYRRAREQADTLRAEAARMVERVTPIVRALGTRPEGGRAAASLARAESLLTTMDFTLARLSAQDAEQIGIAAGVAPPSPQPAAARAAIDVLLLDLARAVASRRAGNLRPLYPAITQTELREWEAFFHRATQLSATYRVERFTERGSGAEAEVRAVYRFLESEGGTQADDIRRLLMRFTRTADGWRIASVRKAR